MADEERPLDLDELRERQPPLAKVIDAISVSNTTRDNPISVADDISIGLTARDESSELGAAFAEFERSLSPEVAEARRIAQDATRKELKERLGDEIEGRPQD